MAVWRTYLMVLHNRGLNVTEKMLGYAHEGQCGHIAVVDFEDSLVRCLRLVQSTWKRGII